MLVATVLVLFMTLPGLALFYGGMVRKKNVLGMLMQCAGAAVIVSILWFVVGYSIAFTPGNGWIGGFDRILFQGVLHNKDLGTTTVSTLAPTVPEAVFVMYQLMFAIITVALIFGAFAERMRFSALLWFTALWTVMVYAPIAHWVWAPSGWLSALGILDFAGGMVVHVNAGFAGLAGAIALGPRIGYGREPLVPHNLGLTVIGACMLWVGWFGFNAGSALAADSRAAFAMLVTHLATAMAAFSWMIVEWMVRGRPSVLGIASGVVAGLVAITPAAGFVSPSSAAVIGFAAGIGCYWGATALKSLFNYDDSLDVFGIHAIGGIIGALLTGVFANHAIGGATGKIVTQLLGTATVAGYSFLATYIILRFVKIIVGLRVPMKIEHDGLDIGLHGESVE
jgi:ammonium transporter, Amt family